MWSKGRQMIPAKGLWASGAPKRPAACVAMRREHHAWKVAGPLSPVVQHRTGRPPPG